MKELLKGFVDTPPLWKNQQFGLDQFKFPHQDISDIPIAVWPKNLRLGHQMEYVFYTLVQAGKNYEVALHNILVEEGKIRVGELDFILRDLTTNRYFHVELAYKFYIVNPEISEPIYRLMGPNKRDMFYTKLDKLKEKQFPLLYHDSLKKYWDSLKIDPLQIEQKCCFKAQLFEPFEQKVSIRPLNTACITGKWIRFDDFNTKEFKKSHYYLPQKIEWVVPLHENVLWLNHYKTLLEVNLRMVKENAPMLWMKTPTGNLEKLFVVWW
jgi:hypothetical protein